MGMNGFNIRESEERTKICATAENKIVMHFTFRKARANPHFKSYHHRIVVGQSSNSRFQSFTADGTALVRVSTLDTQ